MTDTTTADDGWTLTQLGTEQVPTHCGRIAYDLDLGEWECATCDTVAHIRDIRAANTPAKSTC
ncbi:hypothetical protein [Kitasatospora sp. NPDC056181]|uniref:hypothetical protein n=1 Tax=Kitasatospora sp. NPDC056181 TaxID=3345737 RepID=UPI0035D8FBF5